MNLQARQVYRFGMDVVDGNGSMGDLLGGKGAGLAEMTMLGVPVPPGFTVTTAVCNAYLQQGALPQRLQSELKEALRWLEGSAGKTFGDPADPLLVSVRSGAPVSMPGMMDTVLNVGFERGHPKVDPFVTVDQEGVGFLMRMAINAVRKLNPAIKIGVCGEHGGDPESIHFFHSLGVDYVSCSPSRLRTAQLAAAQAGQPAGF